MNAIITIMGRQKETISANVACPLAPTERRLSDCVAMWLETRANYFSPNFFRLSLNNCIQTMRNVTFALQKAKPKFSNFDAWYAGWQDRMRKDGIMRWLTEARNVIVKEGDLSTSSKLRLAVIETWFDPPYVELDAPPFIETEDFLKFLAETRPGSVGLEVGLLRAERRWIDEQLAESELLEALSHVFDVLSHLLLDAHEKLYYHKDLLNCRWYTSHMPCRGQCLACMKAQEWDRTVWLDLNTGEVLRPVDVAARRMDDDKVRNHYPDLIQSSGKREKPTNLKEEADMLFEGAKTILCTNGYHLPMALLGYPDDRRDIIGLQMLNRTEKHLAIRRLAADIERSGATSIILIGEAWVSDNGEYRLTSVGLESPTLREALVVQAANVEGETYDRHLFFTREQDGRIILGSDFSFSDAGSNILAPVREVWNKRHASG